MYSAREVFFRVVGYEEAGVLSVLCRCVFDRVDYGDWYLRSIVNSVYPNVPCGCVYKCYEVVCVVCGPWFNWSTHI